MIGCRHDPRPTLRWFSTLLSLLVSTLLVVLEYFDFLSRNILGLFHEGCFHFKGSSWFLFGILFSSVSVSFLTRYPSGHLVITFPSFWSGRGSLRLRPYSGNPLRHSWINIFLPRGVLWGTHHNPHDEEPITESIGNDGRPGPSRYRSSVTSPLWWTNVYDGGQGSGERPRFRVEYSCT